MFFIVSIWKSYLIVITTEMWLSEVGSSMGAYEIYLIFSSIRQLHDNRQVVPLEPVHMCHLLITLPQIKPISLELY